MKNLKGSISTILVILVFFSILIGKGILDYAYQNTEMITLINEERTKAGIAPLTYYEPLSNTAKEKACDMDRRNYFEHIDPEGNYSWHLLTEAGINYEYAGENLGRNLPTSREVMKAWMESPKHRDNILDPRFEYVGYATCGIYKTQHFAQL